MIFDAWICQISVDAVKFWFGAVGMPIYYVFGGKNFLCGILIYCQCLGDMFAGNSDPLFVAFVLYLYIFFMRL